MAARYTELKGRRQIVSFFFSTLISRHTFRAFPAFLVLLTLGVLVPRNAPAQNLTVPPSQVLVAGEELVYNVRYGFIDLGQVRIRVEDKTTLGNHRVYKAEALIRSYRGVPFVDLHATYHSWMDSLVFSRQFVGKTQDGKFWEYSRYVFEYDVDRVVMETGKRDTIPQRRDTMTVKHQLQDGLSLFFYARDQLYAGKAMNIPALVSEKQVNTYINFRNRRESVEIDAIEWPVDVIYFDGTAEFVGIFGLTGDFEGWFSNDEARIPIQAKMKVIIGSITLELMEWKRAGWIPPRGVIR